MTQSYGSGRDREGEGGGGGRGPKKAEESIPTDDVFEGLSCFVIVRDYILAITHPSHRWAV